MNDEIAERIVQDAADALGEGLLQVTGGDKVQGYEGLAKATLLAGLERLADSEPPAARLETVARAIYFKLHDEDRQPWSELDSYQRGFWHDIARTAIRAADESAVTEIRGK
ncbi:hypothetical protein [Ferruginivarius sediminum]|uniref:Uncharacterized protein n=1 Tax=Ferruginivarius sediminum TaxID=2661937 RepID=A0A369TH66_9PROT|nr:hypothetical protein [Ferruginivarius sediminum]RDD62256.1 hypothetical protein DRB17_08465 [Ferruginivarius sediminum]